MYNFGDRMSEFDFEDWFRRTRKLFEEIDKVFEEMFREATFFPEERKIGKRRVIGPYYYGFSVTIGPDGIPRVREWGNIRPGPIRPVVSEAIEPFTDVFDEGDYYRIIMDIPGVEKENINVEAAENAIMVRAEGGGRKYYKEVKLEEKIKPETAKAQYKNGVLTVTVEKAEKREREKGFRVKVE